MKKSNWFTWFSAGVGILWLIIGAIDDDHLAYLIGALFMILAQLEEIYQAILRLEKEE